MSCKDCHWYRENSEIDPCTNIGESGWEHWMDFKTAPTYCSQYCRKGTYKPEGVWADMAKVINKVSEIIDN